MFRLRTIAVLSTMFLLALTGVASAGTYRGNGGETLPPIRISHPSTLLWTSTGGVFQIFMSGGSSGDINSSASSGSSYLKPGRYVMQVNAVGSWAFRILTGTIRPHSMAGGRIGYSGNGGEDLPPIRLPRAEELYWTCTGSLFQIFDANFLNGIEVNSQGTHGATYSGKGGHTLTINALGSWTVSWKK